MKKGLALLVMLLMLLLTGCDTTTKTYEDEEIDFWEKFVVVEGYYSTDGTLYLIYDKDTKVEYYMVKEGHRFGMCPVYDTDGTVKVYAEEEQ